MDNVIIQQLVAFGYVECDIVEALEIVNNKQDINEIIDQIEKQQIKQYNIELDIVAPIINDKEDEKQQEDEKHHQAISSNKSQNLQQLVTMGFDETGASFALKVSNDNVYEALDYLTNQIIKSTGIKYPKQNEIQIVKNKQNVISQSAEPHEYVPASYHEIQSIYDTDFDELLIILFDGYIREISKIMNSNNVPLAITKIIKKYYMLYTDGVWKYSVNYYKDEKILYFYDMSKSKEWHNFEIDFKISEENYWQDSVDHFAECRCESASLQIIKLEFRILSSPGNIGLGISPTGCLISEYGTVEKNAFMCVEWDDDEDREEGTQLRYDEYAFEILYKDEKEWDNGDIIGFALNFNTQNMFIWRNGTLMYKVKFNSMIKYHFVGALYDRYECYEEFIEILESECFDD